MKILGAAIKDLALSGTASESQGARQARPRGYQAAREVELRAAVGGGGQSAQVQAAVQRLDKLMDQGDKLNPEVPRGHYLNIQV